MRGNSLHHAANAARLFLIDYRLELLGSYCLILPDGTPDLSSADPVESAHLGDVDDLIAGLTHALNEHTHQGIVS